MIVLGRLFFVTCNRFAVNVINDIHGVQMCVYKSQQFFCWLQRFIVRMLSINSYHIRAFNNNVYMMANAFVAVPNVWDSRSGAQVQLHSINRFIVQSMKSNTLRLKEVDFFYFLFSSNSTLRAYNKCGDDWTTFMRLYPRFDKTKLMSNIIKRENQNY